MHATHPVLAALSATSATSTRAGWGGHGGLGGVIGSCEAGARRPLRATIELLGRLRHEWRLLSVLRDWDSRLGPWRFVTLHGSKESIKSASHLGAVWRSDGALREPQLLV
mgnify:CR=1 FL=1